LSGRLSYGIPEILATTKEVGMSSGAYGERDAAHAGNSVKKPACNGQKSAEAIVVKGRRETCGHGEGPNIMNKEDYEAP
jgi:hypothetical protein